MKALPIPKNKPVPMVPPRAMNWMCLDFKLLERPCQSSNSEMARLVVDLPSSHVTIFLCFGSISIDISSLSEGTGLGVDSGVGIDICGVSMAAVIVVGGLIDSVLFLLHGC